jgi:hypothetical protein
LLAFGASCINLLYATDTCFGIVRVGYDLKFAELHVGFVGAQSNGVHERPYYYRLVASEPRSVGIEESVRLGLQVGADFGTPYFRLKSWGNCRALKLAGRASADVDVIFVNQVGGINQHVVFTNTYGPNLAADLAQHVGVYARAGVGWAFIDGSEATVSLDAFAGLRALF